MNIKTIHTKNLLWIDVTNPAEQEIAWLKENYNFKSRHFRAVSEHQQRPHIDQGPGYHFIVLLFPIYNYKSQEISPGEVDFFIGERFLITIHYDEMYTLKKIFSDTKNNAEIREKNMSKTSGNLTYNILENLFRRSYPILDHMSKDIADIEDKIFHKAQTNMLPRIVLMKKNIIEFRTMMKTHRYVLEQLPKKKVSYLIFPQSKTYYRDLLEYSHNIWDVLEALKETVETLQDTYQTLATQRLNEMSKVMSIFSAIVIPATLVAFLFGVGVENIPFRDHPFGFWIIAGLMILSSISLLTIFKLKKWF